MEVFFTNRIEIVLAVAAGFDDSSDSQQGQVMADGRLTLTQLVAQRANVQFAFAKQIHQDFQPSFIGQQLEEVSLRDLMRDALFETAPYSAQKKFDYLFATQRLRVAVEEQRKTASTYGDVAKRLGQLNSEIEIEPRSTGSRPVTA